MPVKAKEMSAIELRNLKPRPTPYPVGGVPGLMVRVYESGEKYFFLRKRYGGRRPDIGIGGFPEFGLKEARDEARRLCSLIRQGIDPLVERRQQKAQLAVSRRRSKTFKEAAEEHLKDRVKGYRNKKHQAQWYATLETYAYPVIGAMAVNDIDISHIKLILAPIWYEKYETARRVRGRIDKVIGYAEQMEYRDPDKGNPASRDKVETIFTKPNQPQENHYKALPYAELPGFLARLRDRVGMSARALEFTILTAARTIESRRAEWSEINLDNAQWTIPAERMKNGLEHTVPLNKSAVALLKALPNMGSKFVFAGSTGKPLSEMAQLEMVRRLGFDVVVHGFRSTFRDWGAEETHHQNIVLEKSLAHKIPDKAERAYRRGELLKKRRKLMEDWDRFCQHGLPKHRGGNDQKK